MNERCKQAVETKNAHRGLETEAEQAELCTAVLREEYAKFVKHTRQKLRTLPRNSKAWWKLNRTLLENRAPTTSVPDLRDSNEE